MSTAYKERGAGDEAPAPKSVFAKPRESTARDSQPEPADDSRPSLAEFLTELLRAAPPGAAAWCAIVPGALEKDTPGWGGAACSAAHPPSVGPQDNAFYSVSAFRKGSRSRSPENSLGVCVALFDDIGTKASAERLRKQLGEPSYRIETSPGNEQWGYLLDRMLSMAELGIIADFAKRYGDPEGNNPVRYARLPAGINGKPEYGDPSPRVQCVEWSPARRLAVTELLRAAKADAPAPEPARAGGDEGPIPKGKRNATLFRLGRRAHRALLKSGMNEELRSAGVYNYLAKQVAPRCEEPLSEAELRSIVHNVLTAKHKDPVSPDDELEFRTLTVHEIRTAIREEQYLIPGLVPVEAYTVIAGALSSYKTFLLLNLIVLRATGVDLLDLTRGRTEPGPAVLLFYEDADWRVADRLKKVLQHGYLEVLRKRGSDAAQEFLELAAANIHRVPLTGKASRTLVCRIDGARIVPNEGLIEELLEGVRSVASSGVMICIDPLRLAIVGSQNDDDGGDVVVHTLNRIAAAIPGSGVVVCSHTTKAQAKESGVGYADASYGTAGSALYSQHARSNFFLARMPEKDIRDTFDPEKVPPEAAARQSVAKLTHGRLSHGAEARPNYILMRDGVLHPVEPRGAMSLEQQMAQTLPILIGAVERIQKAGVRASAAALAKDPAVKELGGRSAIRDLIELAEQNGYLEFEGATSNRVCRVTEKGRSIYAGEVGA